MSELVAKPVLDISNTIQYSPVIADHSLYDLKHKIPQSGSQTVILSNSSQTTVVFSLDSIPMNLSKCCISFDLAVTNSSGVTGARTCVQPNCLTLFDRVQVSTKNSVIFADLQHVDHYGTACTMVNTSRADLINRPIGANAISDIQQSNDLIASNYTPDNAGLPVTGSINYTDPKFMLIGGPIAVAATPVTTTYNYLFNLSVFKDSILSIDKSLFFDEAIEISFTFQATDKYAFIVTAPNTSYVTGELPLSSHTLQNLTLYVAEEVNPNIRQRLKDAVNSSGMTVHIPYTRCMKSTNSPQATHNVGISLSPTDGQYLRKIYYAPFHTTQTLALNHVHSSSTIGSYNSYLAGVQLQNRLITVTNSNDHFKYNKQHLAESVLNNIPLYNQFFTHIDSWIKDQPCNDNGESVDGLILNDTKRYEIALTCSGGNSYALNHYMFYVCTRTLYIRTGSIFLK